MTTPPGPPPNPLVVAPENEDAQPLDSLEGAGVASSWADFGTAVSQDNPDPLQIVAAGAGAGLDSLGYVADPFGSALSAGVGWLIEHVWFLHEPLDALAGDPTQIKASAQTWQHVATELAQVAAAHRTADSTIRTWEGDARLGYRSTVEQLAGALEAAGRNAALLADLLVDVGAHVGTMRALIRDLIADWFVEVVKVLVAWLAVAAATGGSALAGFVLQVTYQALELADRIATMITKLLDTLDAASQRGKLLADAIRNAPHLAEDLADPLESKGAAEVIEAGKQLTGAEYEQRNWAPATG